MTMSGARVLIGSLAAGLTGLGALPARAATETVLHAFTNTPDGNGPTTSLTDVGGVLYGTTNEGGAEQQGTVFTVTTAGAEQVVYSFAGSKKHGYAPGGLLQVGRTLYGATYGGGPGCCRKGGGNGTVYKISVSTDKAKTLYIFPANGGGGPNGLIDVSDTFYGTTFGGGATGSGTVFSVTPSGTGTELYSFKGGTIDGWYPTGNLLNVGGTLYGTTQYGGASNNGTVFTVTPAGAEAVLYSFQGTSGGGDGAAPESALINVGTTLYGVTIVGGAHGSGTVFSVAPSGTETVLYSFGGTSSDGTKPNGSLLYTGGVFYGTTSSGGGSSACTNGCGTVFSITPGGTETVLHAFTGGTDGAGPQAALIDVGGTLYGTTEYGGGACSFSQGCGTVFSVVP